MNITCEFCKNEFDPNHGDVIGACPGNIFCPFCSTEISSEDGTEGPLCGDCEGCHSVQTDSPEIWEKMVEKKGLRGAKS